MEDYKEKYKKVLERAKAVKETYLNLGNISAAIVLESIFPELKESDDERIRKYLINYVKSAGVGHSLFDSVNTRENIITWLEKQDKKNGQIMKRFNYKGNKLNGLYEERDIKRKINKAFNL